MLRSVRCYTEYNSNGNDNNQTKLGVVFCRGVKRVVRGLSPRSSLAEGASLSLLVEESVMESTGNSEEFRVTERSSRSSLCNPNQEAKGS